MHWCGSTPFGLDVEAPRHRRFPDGRRLTLTARFLAISARIGAFSTSRSDLELDESVEDPEVADACSILLSDSLLSGQFGVSAILHLQGVYPDWTVHPFIIIKNKLLLYRLIARLFPNYARYFFCLLCSKLCQHNRRRPTNIIILQRTKNHFNKMKKEVGMLLQKRTDTSAVGIYKLYEENTH